MLHCAYYLHLSETLASDTHREKKIHQTLQKWVIAKEEISIAERLTVSLAILIGDSYAAVLVACHPLSIIDPPLLSPSRSTHLS